MSMRAITRVARRSSSVLLAGALVAGAGSLAANAAGPDLLRSSDPTTVKLKVGSRDADPVDTDATRARGVLEQNGVELSRLDQIDLFRNGRLVQDKDRRELRDGDLVKVVRVWHREHVHTARWEPKTRTKHVTSLPPGKRKVVKKGRVGIRKVHVRAEVHNGRVVDRQIRKHWERRPLPRVVLVGSRLNWAALANCESGGNPRAVNPAGYYGLYQFDLGTWRSVGGSGMPHHASAGEQTHRAQILYSQRGRSPWPNCGRYL
ncbi:hypothetical protein GCM10023146_12730 [Nocardioides caricicola]